MIPRRSLLYDFSLQMKAAILAVTERGPVFLTSEVMGESFWGKGVESVPAAGAFGLELDMGGNGHHENVGHGEEWHERGQMFVAQNTERHKQ